MQYLAPLKDLNYRVRGACESGGVSARSESILSASLQAVAHNYPFLAKSPYAEAIQDAVAKTADSEMRVIIRALNKAVLAGLRSYVVDHYGATTDKEALASMINRRHRVSFFVNSLHPEAGTVLKVLAERGIGTTPCDWFPGAFVVSRGDSPFKLAKSLLHENGLVYVKRLASMLPPALLGLGPDKNQTVLDLCAAPGGKAVQLACLMGGEGTLILNDSGKSRLGRLIDTADRCALSSRCKELQIHISDARSLVLDKSIAGRCDVVMADVPCSSSGLLRQDLSRLQLLSASDLRSFVRQQEQIFDAALVAAKPGGLICYSTCSLTHEENELQVSRFLERNCGSVSVLDPTRAIATSNAVWSLQPALDDSLSVQRHLGLANKFPALRIWPHRYDSEGFFCAVLQKN